VRLNCHELRALICLIGRVRLSAIERTDLVDVLPELERAIGRAAKVAHVRQRKRVS
jgi:hypothetical protein